MHTLLQNHDEILSIQPHTRRLTRRQATALQQQLKTAAEGSACLMLDLSQIDYIDSVGFKVILNAMQAARRAGGDLKLIAPRPAVRALLELTRLYRVFDLHEEAWLAVSAFGQVRARQPLRQRAAQ